MMLSNVKMTLIVKLIIVTLRRVYVSSKILVKNVIKAINVPLEIV